MNRVPESEIYRLELGLLALVFGVWLCVHAMNEAMRSYWHDPKVKSRMLKWLSEHPDDDRGFGALVNFCPSTISQLVSEPTQGHGAIVTSLCDPGLMMAMVGLVLMASVPISTHSEFGLFVQLLRAICMPLGLTMILKTPMSFGNEDFWEGIKFKRLPRRVSTIEVSFFMEWFRFHMIGGVIAFGLPWLLESMFIVIDLVSYLKSPADSSWAQSVHAGWLILIALRAVMAALAVVSLKTFADGQGGIKYQSSGWGPYVTISAEYNCLVAIALMHTAAHTCTILADRTYSLQRLGYVWCIIVWHLYLALTIMFPENLFYYASAYRLRQLSKMIHGNLSELNEWASRLSIDLDSSPVRKGLAKLCGHQFRYLRVVQPGSPNKTEDGYEFGVKAPKIPELMIRPDYYSTLSAVEMHEVEDESLRNFNTELALILKNLPSADTLFIPMGEGAPNPLAAAAVPTKNFKSGLDLPFIRLAFSRYAEELARIDAKLEVNSEAPEMPEDEVAYDITNLLLHPFFVALRQRAFVDVFASRPCKEVYEACWQLHAGCNTDDVNVPAVEVQIRGVYMKAPRIVVRLERTNHKLIEHLQTKLSKGKPLTECALYPPCLADLPRPQAANSVAGKKEA